MSPKLPRLYHSEEGEEWDFLTDLAWVPQGSLNPTLEVLSSSDPQPPSNVLTLLKYDTEIKSKNQSHFDSFLNTYRTLYRFHRKGIHLHVQYRDVHEAGVTGSGSYLNWPYSDSYLRSVLPEDDLNVWGDGLDESLIDALPPHQPTPGGVLADMGNESLVTAMIGPKTGKRCSEDDNVEETDKTEPKRLRLDDMFESFGNCDIDEASPSYQSS